MEWTKLHAAVFCKAFEKILGKTEAGSMAFVRCLSPEVVESLAHDRSFAPNAWEVWCVAGSDNRDMRTITADRAVEIREKKGIATLLLVDTMTAGAGMDGIYSAALEVDESTLFRDACSLAAHEVTNILSREHRQYAEKALKKARGHGYRFSVSLWTEFDFLIRVAASKKHPGELLYLLGLWPAQISNELEVADTLDVSRMFVDRLLGTAVSVLTTRRRIESLRLLNPTEQQIGDLERFLRYAATKPLLSALADLASTPCIWVNALQIEGATENIQSIDLISWRTNTGKIANWSGLVEEGEENEPPVLILKPDAEKTGDYSKLEVKWKTRPENLDKGAVEYRVVILTDMDEELASHDVTHTGKREEKCRFSNDDFSMLLDDALFSAKVKVSVIGNDSIKTQPSEEFKIRYGQPPERERGGVGKKLRAFSEGFIEFDNRELVSNLLSSASLLPMDSKGFVLFRAPQHNKSFRVFRPPLIDEVDKHWTEQIGPVGRWYVKVRASGTRAGTAQFVPISRPPAVSEIVWDRTVNAHRRMAERFGSSGGSVGQVYDEKSKGFDTVVKEYILSWTALFEEGIPILSLVNTVEVQSLSGRTIGLIVLPNHPLRVAWHVAYDNLIFHARFAQNATPKDINREFLALDGAMFPAFLPGLEGKNTFVFADMLGFHAVGMVLDSDREPKAAVALLARALGESETDDTAPTVGKQSAQILGNEILKYMQYHNTSRLLHIHALRPGDGLTVARSLGCVQKHFRKDTQEEYPEEEKRGNAPSFVLELYPSKEQRGVAGRFIAEARQKRRSGAGFLLPDDHWMLESSSLPGGVNLPRLRWARKNEQDPHSAAHLAVAFDTFESRVLPFDNKRSLKNRPLYAFGLLSFFEREFTNLPYPLWRSTISASNDGEKHPSDRMHTERLVKLQQAVSACVSSSLSTGKFPPSLTSEISADKAQNLKILHRLCDWVITLDRNACIEYFDSPGANRDIYDAYVIDCVPEREDLGCLQLITSTSNMEEVRNLLDGALDQMGLSQSRRNAEFLLEHLKSLSGRLAIRLTGQKAPRSELIALSLCHANCRNASENNECWTALESGFLIPVDDIRDLLPPLIASKSDQLQEETDEKESRPDLIHVSLTPRKGLLFRFIEVKYRRHLRAARNPEELQSIREQVESLRRRWDEWYLQDEMCPSFRAIRRAKLARVLRFYADKAHRHRDEERRKGLLTVEYKSICAEIDRMIEKGGGQIFAEMQRCDRGWVFCPEYTSVNPLEISPADWETRIFLFGPGLLPDSDFRRDSIVHPIIDGGQGPACTTDFENAVRVEPSTTSKPSHSFDAPVKTDIASENIALQKNVEKTVEVPPSVSFGLDVLTDSDVRWPLTVKGNPHLLIAGLPGMGKTTCLINLCKQMLNSGIHPIVFSYHQDIDERLEQLVDSVRFIDFRGLGFNPLRVLDRKSPMAFLDVAGALRDIFLAIFPELGDIQGERIRKAIKDSFIEVGWEDTNIPLAEQKEPAFSRFVDILRSDPKPDKGLRSLLARLEELGDYGFFNVQENEESLWDSKKTTVIRIHTTQNDNLQKAFASLVFYGLYKDMFRRGIRDSITHAVIFDEAHRAAGLKLIPTMAKECRKYGISLVLASQEAKDFNASLFSAIANYLVLRLTETDAKALVRNVASSQQERLLIDKIKQLERFKALYFCEGRTKPSMVALLS